MERRLACPKCGYPSVVDDDLPRKCSACLLTRHKVVMLVPDERHITPLEPTDGPKRSERFMPQLAPRDRLHKHMDWAAGQEISSRSQRRKVYAEKGLVEKSYSDHKRQHGGLDRVPGAISFPGQKDRKSSSEKQKII